MPEMALGVLHAGARRSYESGRLIGAGRAAFIVVPFALICAHETEEWRRCAMVGLALLVVSIAARWRLPNGRRSVDAGLVTGAIPMAAALVLCRFAGAWPDGTALGVCAIAGFVSGVLAGRVTAGAPQWATASIVAGLTAALGCVGIGLGTAIGGTAAVALGAIVATQLPGRAAA
jgi:hypothetical protein